MSHTWSFFRAGGVDQPLFDSGSSLAALAGLDQKLWAALACPTQGLELEEATLKLVDGDGDGRIRAPELLAALKWTLGCLKSPDSLLKGASGLPLEDVDDSKPDGHRVLASIRQILFSLGKAHEKAITTDDVKDALTAFNQSRFNGDGVIPAASAEEPVLQAAVSEILSTVAGAPDRGGQTGLDTASIEQFFNEAQAYCAWQKAGTDAVLPLGDQTAAAAALWNANLPKIEDWLTRSRLAAYDSRALGALDLAEASFGALGGRLLSTTMDELSALPLAKVVPGAGLPLGEGVNPAWAAVVAQLRREVIEPLLGARRELSAEDVAAVQARLAPYLAWKGAEPATRVGSLGVARLEELSAGPVKASLLALVAKDAALAPEAAAIATAEKLVRLHRDLVPLLRNFVSFEEFYRSQLGTFQCGTLYLDQRSFNLCIPVLDAGRHAAMAGGSQMYLLYCDLHRKATGETMSVAVAVTDGDSDNLSVGRNGIFYDRQGRDWDATIARIVDQPISIRQAFWAPYKKLVRFVEDQFTKFAASREAASAASTTGAVGSGLDSVGAEKKDAPAFDVAKFAGIFAAIGLAVGALGSVVLGLFSAVIALPVWQLPFVFAGLLLLISGPSMLLAAMKLRLRNLGPVLDANGWAVNARARINVPFGRTLTHIGTLPAGSRQEMGDPYAEEGSGGLWIVLFCLLLGLGALWYAGTLETWLPGVLPPPPGVGAPPAPATEPAPPPT